jgi:hypothetical protein
MHLIPYPSEYLENTGTVVELPYARYQEVLETGDPLLNLWSYFSGITLYQEVLWF